MSYDQGVPNAAPRTDAPNDYQQITPKFGEGLQRLGDAALKTSDTFNQFAADDAFNQYQAGVGKLLHGDPSKKVMGQDGALVEDTGYLGLTGRAALDARPAVEKSIDDLGKQLRTGLGAQTQLAAFDSNTERYKTSTFGQISTHADTQQKTWFGTVATAAENNALTEIANYPDDPVRLKSGAADLINARTKQAELAGAVPGDPVWLEAIASGKRDTLKTQVLAIAAKDPSRAIRILDKNKTIAGPQYEQLYSDLRARADQQDGIAAGQTALDDALGQQAPVAAYTNPALPIYQQAASAIPGGMSAAGLARTVQLESSGNPNAANASDHVGLGAFSAATAAEVGLADRTNGDESILAIQRYAARNAPYLAKKLGRPPTDAELYLAHQQGAGGAASLLTNPNTPAAVIVGSQAVLQNGGTQGMTSAEYAAMWTHKFNGTTPQGAIARPSVSVGMPDSGLAPSLRTAPPPAPPVAIPPAANSNEAVAPPAAPAGSTLPSDVTNPTSPKAAAYQAIMARDDLTPEAKQHAIAFISQQMTAMQIAADTTAAQIKQANDAAANGYMTNILNGDVGGGLDASIANDPKLTWETKSSLTSALLAHANSSATGATAAYGDGFWNAYKQVTAEPGDPSRISDVGQLLRRAGPGGDLTLAGVQQLSGYLSANQRSVDDAAVNTSKTALMAYAKSKLSFQQDVGPVVIRDPEGEKLFNARFVPQYEAAYDAWKKAGKDPWEFLTQDNVDKMLSGMRSPREMALAQLQAQETGLDSSQLVAPPTPPGVDETAWKLVVNAPPLMPDGKQSPPDKWVAAVTLLQQQPTAERMAQFDQFFGAVGVKSSEILDVLGVAPRELTDAEKAAAAAKAKENPAYPGAHATINGVEDLGLPLPAGQ